MVCGGKVCFDKSPNDRDERESEGGEIVSGQTVVSCCQAPPVLEAAEEALDEVATSIDCAIERVRNSPRCGGWNDRFDAAESQASCASYPRHRPCLRSGV